MFWETAFLFSLVALIYVITTIPYPVTGYHSDWLYRHLSGDLWFPSPRPIAGWWAYGLRGLPQGHEFAWAAFSNTGWMLAGLFIFNRLARRFPFYDGTPQVRERYRERIAFLATGLVGLSPATWSTATQPGPAPLAFFVFMLTAALWQYALQHPTRMRLGTASFLLGLSIIETPAATVLGLPLFIVVTALVWSRRDRRVEIPVMAGSLLAGLITAIMLLRKLAVVMMGETPLWSDIFLAWRADTGISLFPVGWLSVLVLSGGALFLSAWATIPARKRTHRRTIIIQCALTAGLIALYMTHPWSNDTAHRGRVPLMPELAVAVALSVSIAFLFRHFSVRQDGTTHIQRFIYIALAFLLQHRIMEFQPLRRIQEARTMDRLHQTAFDDTAPEIWVLSDGAMDAPLWFAGQARGLRIIFLHPAMETQPAYLRRLSRQFTDERYRAMAEVGIGALLAEFRSSNASDISVTGMRHYATMVLAGLRPVPHLLRYDGSTAHETIDGFKRGDLHHAWDEMARPTLQRAAKRNDVFGRHAQHLLRLLSRAANDLGVHAEYEGQPERAQALYRQALNWNPLNVSAGLNTLSDERLRAPTETLRRELGRGQTGRLAALVETDGLIYRRALIEFMEEAIQQQQRRPETLSRLFPIARLALEGRTHEAFTAARRFTAEHPDDIPGWIMLASLAHERNDTVLLHEIFQRADRTDPAWTPLWAMLGERAMNEGDLKAARRHFETAARHWPLNLRTREALLKIAWHDQDTGAQDRHLRDVLTIDPGNPWAHFVLGLRRFAEGDHPRAERMLLATISREPMPIALNNLAWLMLRRGQTAEALWYVRMAINLEPYGGAQWDTLASILLEQGEWTAAGIALQTALRLDPESPAAAVHYAFWKRQTGTTFEEGEVSMRRLDPQRLPDDERLKRLWRLAME
ncbi:MAG TPA: tetratricopeptide repeat protein [Kiritimatiellia bacterium]|nr:tetratricopeptide repeat protein [Kiritimatiellia bacterium]HMO98393.1 tetratricopeptide repeat protein [Kiritimatiellia bacterium]HMP96446.1 tetratricopeptide repeat protein [Kiritimatiellia bacterium]